MLQRTLRVRVSLAVALCALAAVAACPLDTVVPPTDAGGPSVVADAELDAGAVAPSPDAALPLRPEDAALSAPDADQPCAADVPYELRQVVARGFTFNVWVAGPDDGEAVLLLHGFPESSFEWRRVVPALVARGYRVIAPDQRGYSPGARPKDDAAYAIFELASDALALADALSVRTFHLVGHDWGGGVAWLVARLAPLRVMSLTAVSTPHPDAMASALRDDTSCQHRASAYFDNLVKPGAAELFMKDPRLVMLDAALDPLPDPDGYARIIGDEAALDAALAWYRANIQDRKFKTIALGKVDVPTVLLIGDEERVFCRDTAAASASYMAAPFRLQTIPGVGHWIPEQASRALLDALFIHLEANRARVHGAMPEGPDSARPLGTGLSGSSCRGAPAFEVPAGLAACDSVCPAAHCLPANTLGEASSLAPACPGNNAQKCVPDALTRALGRVAFAPCSSLLGGSRSACVPTCLVGALGLLLDRATCGSGEVCAPCNNPLTGEPTGACADLCQGL